jgi:hypothetical protein
MNAAAESLHAFWDGLLGDRLTPDQSVSMAASLPQPDPVRASRADPEIWFDESEAAAEAFAYAPPIGDGDGPYNLTDGYRQKAIEVAHAQAGVAGARLAGLLNAALAGP